MSSTKTLSVFLKLNSKEFTSGLKKIEGKLNKFGNKLGKIGSNLTTGVTAPLLGIGGAAVKTASDFEKSMTRIETLVGLPRNAVDELGKSVLELAGKTATAPQELADGLYFLTSAGLDSESALKALEATAKGSAAGLGEMESLATVAAAAQNAYGEEVITASQSLDIFGKMVQSGMFKSEELASVLGSQLGLASNLGISMEELGSLISTYTRTTGSATDATTGLSGIMMSFAKITPKAEAALAKATAGMKEGGMTADDLRTFLGEQGLQKTLLMLQEKFEETGTPMSEFFSKSQALKGALGVLGSQTESYTEILSDMEQSQGFVNDAFDRTTETSAFKFNQALTNLKVAGVQLGESLMPIATKIADTFSKMANSFSNMTQSSRENIVKLGAALVALGPTIMVIGQITKAFGILVKTVRIARAAVVSIGVAARAMNPIGATIAFIVAGVGLMIKNWDIVKIKIVEVVNKFIDLYNESMIFRAAIEGIKFAFDTVWRVMKAWASNTFTMLKGIGNAIVDLINFRSPVDSIKEALNDMSAMRDTFVSDTAQSFNGMMDNIQMREKVEFISESDLDDQVANVQNKMTGLMDNLKGSMNLGDLFSGGADMGDEELPTFDGVLNIDGFTINGEEQEEGDGTGLVLNVDGNTDPVKEDLTELASSVETAFNKMGDSEAKGGMEMVKQIGSQTRDIIKAKIAEGTASIAASILSTVPPPMNMILAAAAGTVAGTLFTSIIPPFAQGGLVTGATLAMVGEGRGTTRVNPEVIAPLDKLKSMLDDRYTGKLSGSILGSDILLSTDRSQVIKNRIGGSATDF